MKNRNIIKLFTFLWSALLIVSCSNEDLDRKDGPTVPEGIPVTAKLTLATPDAPVVETKAVDNGNTFGDIDNVAVLSYNSTGADVCATFISGNTSGMIEFNTKTGNRKTYVLVNLPTGLQTEEALVSNFKTERDILTYKIENPINPIKPTGKEMMMGYVVTSNNKTASNELYQAIYTVNNPAERSIGTAASIEVTEGKSFYASVRPPYSHIDFIIDNQCKNLDNEEKGIRVVITSITVHNLPKRYSLFPENWAISDVEKNPINIKSKDESVSLEGTNFYMFENAQGVNEDVQEGSQKEKRPFGWPMSDALEDGGMQGADGLKAWESLWAETACTYIQVNGYYAKWKKSTDIEEGQKTVGEIRYRFFLGENNFNSLDVKRNTKYKVTLELKPDAGYNEIVVNWRVGADLKTIGFSRRAVIMDGEGQYVYPFRIINNTNEEVKVVVDNFVNGPWKVKAEGADYPESGSLQGLSNKGGMYFEMTSNEFSIVGASASGDKSTWLPFNVSSYTQNDPKDENSLYEKIRRGEIYRQRSVKAYLGQTKVDEIYIRQYPLLYLPNTGTEKSGVKKGPYVERIEENGTVNSKVAAQNRCEKLYNNGAYTWRLPTKKEFLVMTDNKTKDLLYELNPGNYWTSDGLINVSTGLSVANGNGYVRCVLMMGAGSLY